MIGTSVMKELILQKVNAIAIFLLLPDERLSAIAILLNAVVYFEHLIQ